MDFASHSDSMRKVATEVASLLHSGGHEEIFTSVFPGHSGSLTSASVVNRVKESSRTLFLTLMQERLQRYVTSEEEATKERIRIFKEQQEAILGLKKTRVERVKDALARLAGQLSSETDAQAQQIQDSMSTLHQEYDESQTDGNHEATQEHMVNHGVDVDSGKSDDGLFDLDDFDSDHADGDSDGYQTDEDGSIVDSGMEMRRPSNDSHEQQLLATSVPISMPAFSGGHHKQQDSDNELAKDIGASIKKLALSVQDCSDTLFGDLPRPRVNSDAAKRWH
ncbi:uncharacterized protein LOC134189325 [Corticium candelabrum]|uniref:uncharacterized protein LOC134189325 n=1 Tax=Corticium candelabrum TaxID=121492 RepID=UPI002E2579BF|nr:uncharacterized protein LOC134189325 [Corticium candelabrum]